VRGTEIDFLTVSPEELNAHLCRFYAEATPKFVVKCEKEMTAAQAQVYNKSSFKSIRAGINRHIKNLDRDVDIVRDKHFRKSSEILDGKLKHNLQKGLSRPTKYKNIISVSDLDKINTYLFSANNPVVLRFRVWYNIAIHFVSRGLEFHQQLNLNSFVFHKDENDREFVVLSHETKQKNWQGGLDGGEAASDKRMYAVVDSEKCPVRNLKLLLDKTDPTATSLFNHCSKDALISPDEESIWYTTKPVKQYQFSRFMSDISKNSKCSKSYTAHCLRATAIQGMSDAGFQLRHIMYMSGHKNESSVRSYNRSCSSNQKEALSDTLSTISTCNPATSEKPAVSNLPVSSCPTPQNEIAVRDRNVPLAVSSSNFMYSGFISNSSFDNCVFQINPGEK